ncbi:sensor histidine kinase [Aurantibacillus circumpalustris]|uniref:sensor histidine kinase n=1 Tax=Aurantibacillus circumpalustris TaxID=3036359 RepID=UPI00295A8B1A|nr:HAMP domain-containing sensor histidine kinase [Aurantibacillus circumpalustris]
MKFKRFGWNIFIKVLLVFATLLLASFALVKGWYLLELIIVPLIVFLFIDYYKFNKKAQSEIQQFVEAVHYRDFSRYFDVKRAPAELQPFRTGFNEINDTFKIISKEKETQYLHLKTILEIVDTGILSYETESGEILWMNESLKNLLQIPYLKTIHSLEKRNKELYDQIITLSVGNNVIGSITKDKSVYKILLSPTTFQSENKTYKLIAFQNINEALDETESKAWQKLLSVMTHEIMNSVAPISSLAETLKHNVQESIRDPKNSKETLSDIETGISTIQKRSEGLLKFTETYRNLSKITKATVVKVMVMELFEQVQQLMQPTLEKKKIELEVILRDPFLFFEVDPALIEQVLINLVLNAIDAVRDIGNPKIILATESFNGKVILKVADNGGGIKPELLDKIFIPFFSTKKTGSGIGLSLCKQIMVLHKGAIKIQSNEGEGTLVTLVF